MNIALEDSVGDIIGKAMRGLGLTAATLSGQTGIPVSGIEALCKGKFDEPTARKVAEALRLNPNALVAIGSNQWVPAPVQVQGLAMFTTPFEDITVNSYIISDVRTKEAVAFDTGADCQPMLDYLTQNALTLRFILITHAHGDHIFDLDRLHEKTGAPAFVCEREKFFGPQTFEAGKLFRIGKLEIDTRQTWGHSAGGITYVVAGLDRPVAIVGDAMFAGSMGRANVSYTDALESNRDYILSLPDDTVLCPGHGPLTTVGEERRNNPFFA